MNIIAAVDKNWAIGFQKKLLTRIPNDMKNFRKMTLGKVIVMGRKTLESFPGGQPLEQRTNIVLSGNLSYCVKGAIVVHTLEELDAELEKYHSEDIFVVGGESIYRQMLNQCETAYITQIDHAYQADTWFPNLDEMPEWKKTEIGEEQTCFDLEYCFIKYERNILKG